MDAIALHLEIRNALSLSDELSRHEHALGNDALAGHLAAARSALSALDRTSGRSHDDPPAASPTTIEALAHAVAVVRERLDEVPADLRPRLGQLLSSIDRVVYGELRPMDPVPAKPVLGVLPLARRIPQDVHSMMDYASALSYGVSAKLARTTRGAAVGMMLGGNVAGVSLMTDYRLSLSKVVPIEMHEVLDHVTGLTAITAPFLLGYWRKDPIASAVQIGTGLAQVVASLFTDYRADKGIGPALRSKGGPRRTRRAPRRVPEASRPLEGLSGAGVLPVANL